MKKQTGFLARHLMASVLFIIAASPATWGWGPAGHKTVGNVAEHFMPVATKQILKRYLPNESLADVSNWPDTLKDKPDTWGHTFSYHFESVADNETYLRSLEGKTVAERKKGGTVAAILEAKRVFKDVTSRMAQKAQAIKYLVHFVGDLHQPLHSGRPEDRGGNMVERKWHGKSTNLHAIWDVSILEDAYGSGIPTLNGQTATFRKDKYSTKVKDVEYAQYLIRKYQGQPLPTGSDDINRWIVESMALRDDAYAFKDESEADYVDLFKDDVDKRIYYGGVRLASLLNRLLKSEADTQVELSFRSSIERILGPLNRVINLNPKAASRDVDPEEMDL
jgi:hypothetical protein